MSIEYETTFTLRAYESSVLDELMEETSLPTSQIRDENQILSDEEAIASIISETPRRHNRTAHMPAVSPLAARHTSRVLKKTKQRSKKAKNNDFTICLDGTAEELDLPSRTYYGSNVPALGDRTNGGKFLFTPMQFLRLGYDHYRDHFEGDMDALERLDWVMRADQVKLEEAVKGYYQWTHDEHHNDVSLWVQDKQYDRSWAPMQKESFKDFVSQIGKKSRAACAAYINGDYDKAIVLDKKIEPFIQARLAKLRITNLAITKERSFVYSTFMCTYLFYPVGEDMPRHRRADFHKVEAERIDKRWPEYWAEGERPKIDD